MKIIAAAALTLLAGAVHAEVRDTLPLALTDAFTATQAMPSASTYEYGGVVVQSAAGFTVVPSERGTSTSFSVHVRLHAGEKIVAIYHTHPGTSDQDRLFSPDDVTMARSLNVPSYVLMIQDHAVKAFIPGRTPTFKLDRMRPDVVSRGADFTLPTNST